MREPSIGPAGSSPLTRGKRRSTAGGLRGCGLIPAHAGKTPWGVYVSVRFGAHPRSRGENGTGNREQGSTPGSSPLTRGKRREVGSQRRNPGLIPAHAGKTSSTSTFESAAGAHPRSRGENAMSRLSGSGDWGSSPLTRGKQRLTALVIGAVRLIPAHAGKTPVTRA